MPCFLLNSYEGFERVWCLHPQVHPADGGTMIFRNVGTYLLVGTA